MRTDHTVTVVGEFLSGLEDPARELAYGEWGLSVDAAGWPLDIGIAAREGLLRIQANVCAAGQLSPEDLLWWNRRIHLVRFSSTRDGEVWLSCDLLPDALDARQLDRVLGLFVLTATQARQHIPT
ncbi:MAG: hypothetical protein F2799_05455 [Actinobacteria bacterium]|uniref:Unannotated protein n=1 Tax=freshwater metagenome TaxID=449393 RepID=A0A6J7E8L3_9ZZZZ|nr:hypothetical protein [Actinomycetota bacterium]